MALSKETLDQLTAEFKSPQELQSAYLQMLQNMINRALEDEMQAHLGHERNGRSSRNARNGKGRKTVLNTEGALQINTPRDRDGTFEPQLVQKRQVRLAGMEEKILALYARGMTTRDIELERTFMSNYMAAPASINLIGGSAFAEPPICNGGEHV